MYYFLADSMKMKINPIEVTKYETHAKVTDLSVKEKRRKYENVFLPQ